MKRSGRFDFKPLGLAIKEAREVKGESRTVASEAIGISVNELVCIETRGQHPSFQTLYELATRYGISVDKYFGSNVTEPSVKEESKSVKRIELEQLVDDISEIGLNVLIAAANVLKTEGLGKSNLNDNLDTNVSVEDVSEHTSAKKSPKGAVKKSDNKAAKRKSPTSAKKAKDVSEEKSVAKRVRKPKA